MQLTPEQQDLWRELVSESSELLLQDIKMLLENRSLLINRAVEQAGLMGANEEKSLDDPGEESYKIHDEYLMAILHQRCFEWLHGGDAEIAKVIADNQSQLAAQLPQQ
ncbi:hypothetical protein HQQ94_21845 [Shewanella sp. VB17]|uniref:hypothetical protein n=1 Tax=Shewanella sp. VB17 TaxID=2739432 RepID=UPI001565CAE7|nr:hypothetical protein [Shewanella sp. VB17]NRD75810.1 hypothetical protein [Shewanella sp. VB17]